MCLRRASEKCIAGAALDRAVLEYVSNDYLEFRPSFCVYAAA
jgi:hypothetical protein